MIFRLSSLAVLLVLSMTGTSHAQSEEAAVDKSPPPATYAQVSLQSMSELLFRKDALKTSDPIAVDEYLRLHYCGLYDQYGRDDFAWARIRASAARDIELHKVDTSDGVEVQNLIYLQEYDMAANQMPLVATSAMNNVQMITAFDTEGYYNACPKVDSATSFTPRAHPSKLYIKLSKPFSLTAFNVARPAASKYLEYVNGITDPRVRSLNLRPALVVMRIRAGALDPLAQPQALENSKTLLGQLIDLKVYEGPARRLLMYSKSFEGQEDEAGKN